MLSASNAAPNSSTAFAIHMNRPDPRANNADNLLRAWVYFLTALVIAFAGLAVQ